MSAVWSNTADLLTGERVTERKLAALVGYAWLACATLLPTQVAADKFPRPMPRAGSTLWIENADPNNLRHFRAALANVRTGAGIAKIAFIGNSKTAGFIGRRQTSFPSYFAARLNAIGVPATIQSVWGNANYGGGQGLASSTLAGYTSEYNSQLAWSNLTNWSAFGSNGVQYGSLGGSLIAATGSGGTMSFSPAGMIDQCDIYYVAGPGNGSFTWNFNGGQSTTINSNETSTIFTSITISTTAGSSNVLNIAWASGGNIYISAIACRLSSSPSIEVYNMGWGASTTTDQYLTDKAWNVPNALPVVAPSLTVIAMDTNDYTPSYGPIALRTYRANLQGLIAAALQTGDCAIVTEVPSKPSRQSYAIQNQYHAAEHALAARSGCVLFDITNRWGAYEAMNAVEWYSDNTHGTPAAYSDQGEWIADALMAIN
jgi:hypothetical protein